MGGLIQTRGTGYLSWFYNNEFELNWAFHQGIAAKYNPPAVLPAAWNIWDNLIESIVDPTGRKCLKPTPDASQPHLVPRWAYFFKKPILSQANQTQLATYIYNALTTAGCTGILFGVRNGPAQTVETSSSAAAPIIRMINIVVKDGNSTQGWIPDKPATAHGRDPPELDPQ